MCGSSTGAPSDQSDPDADVSVARSCAQQEAGQHMRMLAVRCRRLRLPYTNRALCTGCESLRARTHGPSVDGDDDEYLCGVQDVHSHRSNTSAPSPRVCDSLVPAHLNANIT